MRTGIGSAAYGFDAGRVLMVGGVKVPGLWGLRGHGDGDVLLRALCDALLGAAALGGVDDHFPADDPAWRDAPSATAVAECVVKLAARNLAAHHVDAVVQTEREELREHAAAMAMRVGALLGLGAEAVNVKTAEGGTLGAEGIGALVIATVGEGA